ncbi:MAG: hypothetical protein WC909_00930 [Candidatus Paceibacterota bacterium]|jgi:uncharacterized repeat protein (TIGR01451 family)
MKNIINKIKYNKFLLGTILAVVFTSIIPFSIAFGANVFNSASTDNPLRIGNNTQSSGTQNWQTNLTGINAGDELKFSVYFHNSGDIDAQNTNVSLVLSSSTASTSFSATSTISATSFTSYVSSASMALTSSQTIQFSTTAKLYTNYVNGAYQNIVDIPVTVSGNVVSYNLGTISPGYSPNDGYIIFSGSVSNNYTPTPTPTGTITVSAGSSQSVLSGQSISLYGTAVHSIGLAMTYQWSCNGGSLSNSTVLQPTFYAPTVSSTQTYSCTLTARDSNNVSSSATTIITVNPSGGGSVGYPSVSAGSNQSVLSGQSISLYGTATHSAGLAMTYQWSCNGGSLSNSTVLQPTFYAPTVSSTQTYNCTLIARDSNNNSASSTTYITVNPSGGGYYYSNTPVVSAGSNQSVLSGQSISLYGSASNPNGLYMTYQWSCNGGSIYNSTTLYPTFYAPTVSSTQTYNCTLTARDSNNNSASSTTYITVNTSGYYYGGGNMPTVSAGPSKNLTGGQSTILEGTANSYNGLYMTYQWSCNGGSISYPTSLRPTYYAPSTSSARTYTCTLTVRDSNNNTATSSTYIYVNSNSSYSNYLSATTNAAESVASSSATLKGSINNSYGNNVSVRFNWGTSSQITNVSQWQYNKTAGNVISSYISGLEVGKTYYYRIEAYDGTRTVYGEIVSFTTKPSSVSNFNALASGSNRINLTWNKAVDSCYTMVVRKTGSYPTNGADGTVVYYGTSNSYLDTNISNNVWYYYKAWAVGCDQGSTSFSDSQQTKAYTVATTTVITNPIVTTTSNAEVEVYARNITQDEFSWQNSIIANPGDEIDFRIVITPTGNKSLEDVKLSTYFSNRITSITDMQIDGNPYYMQLNQEVNFGTINLGITKVISFKGTISEGGILSEHLNNSVTVSAKNITSIQKNVVINVSDGISGASLLDIVGGYGWLLFIIVILMVFSIMYLLIERNQKEKVLAGDTKAEKSKYFNIK